MKKFWKDKKIGHYFMGQAIGSVALQAAPDEVRNILLAHERELVASGYICSRLYVDNLKRDKGKKSVSICPTEQYMKEAYDFYIEGGLRSSVSPDQLWEFFLWFNETTGFITVLNPSLSVFSIPPASCEWYADQVMLIPEKAREHLRKEIEGAHGY
ncbi:TPA: hypothetical protein LAL36_004344 [Escherichia coli]|nr:hypothetical protein [Escherichia coli]